MSEAISRDSERTGAELEFDELWKPVSEAHSRYDAFIQQCRSDFPSVRRADHKPSVTFSSEVDPGLGEHTDQEIFEKYVDTSTLVSGVARYVRAISLQKDIEVAVSLVNEYFGFDRSRKDAFDRAYTGAGEPLFLISRPREVYGISNRKSVRLFGFNIDGTAAVIKRWGDHTESLEEHSYQSFSYGHLPNFKPTLDSGDYELIPEAETIDGGTFQ